MSLRCFKIIFLKSSTIDKKILKFEIHRSITNTAQSNLSLKLKRKHLFMFI